jgi:hypothetical protein
MTKMVEGSERYWERREPRRFSVLGDVLPTIMGTRRGNEEGSKWLSVLLVFARGDETVIAGAGALQ